jgi:hypothetical protein
MSGFYVLDVPEFASLLAVARRTPGCHVYPPFGHYYFVEYGSALEILRKNTGMEEAVWYGCLTAGLDGEVAHFDSERLVLSGR